MTSFWLLKRYHISQLKLDNCIIFLFLMVVAPVYISTKRRPNIKICLLIFKLLLGNLDEEILLPCVWVTHAVIQISRTFDEQIDILFDCDCAMTCTCVWGDWGCEVSCCGHHRQNEKKTNTTGSALDGAVLDCTQILAYLVHNMSRSQLYLRFGHFGWLPSLFGQ